MYMSEMKDDKFVRYRNENQVVFSNRIIQDFFSEEHHVELLLRMLDGEEGAQKELEDRFRKHFFQVRFIKFLVSTIKFCSIDQVRHNRKHEMRNQLIFDRPVSEEGEATLGEMLLVTTASQTEPIISDPVQYQASFVNEKLSKAFSALSPRQQLITTLYYALCYQDNEIARILGVSAQAVGKTRNLALNKLLLAMLERRESVG